MRKQSGHFASVVRFTEALRGRTSDLWKDEYGTYRFSIGSNSLESLLTGLKSYDIFAANYLREHLPLFPCILHHQRPPEHLISIGSFETHNAARKICKAWGSELITVPVPLANDSFCTNRCSASNGAPSHECMFPRQTIIDIDLLKCFPLSKNALGFGEFVGLYCSLLDYCEVRAIPLSDSPLAFIVELFKESVQAYRANSDTWLEITAICLIFKCLIMRENGDHQIGCGIDHMIAGVLKEVLQVPHGIAVYWGTIFALVLFPEWECFGLDLHTLLTVGTDLNLISSHEVQRVLSLEPFSLITAAMRLRPERPTVLQTVLTERWRFVSVYEFYNSLKISSFGKDN